MCEVYRCMGVCLLLVIVFGFLCSSFLVLLCAAPGVLVYRLGIVSAVPRVWEIGLFDWSAVEFLIR